VHGTIRTVHTTYAAALKTTADPKTRCRKPYAATQHLMRLMMGVFTRNMSSKKYINKITLLHQVGIHFISSCRMFVGKPAVAVTFEGRREGKITLRWFTNK